MRHIALLGVLALAAAAPAQAENTYRPVDAARMEACLSEVAAKKDDAAPMLAESCIGVASNLCQDEEEGGYSTVGMADCTNRETAWWDARLNQRYAEIKASIGPEEFSYLRTAQRAWLAFREADCSFQYFYWREGTIRSTFGTTCYLQATAERALALDAIYEWVNL